MITPVKKLAVFDLDGTLWSVNSHYELLNQYYKTKFWTSFAYKVLARCATSLAYQFRDRCFRAIADDFVASVNFPFVERYVRLLEEKRQEGFFILIVSNAPREIIVRNAADRLRCAWLCAQEGGKLQAVKQVYQYKKLFVCTDNRMDLDLLSAADEYCIVTTSHSKKFFQKRGFYVE